ncbi:MAG: IS21-like element helper ATPase IstB [Gammaproteobacteria bacterium]
MLTHPLVELLASLRLSGMKQAFVEQLTQEVGDLSFEERFSLLLEREKVYRDNKRLLSSLRQAQLRHTACVEDIDYQQTRGLQKSMMMSLYDCQWVKQQRQILITGPTGTGKSYIACALAHKACLEGYKAKYLRFSRFFQEMLIAKADGSYTKWLQRLTKINVLILDDWGLVTMDDIRRRDLLEVLDERYMRSSTIVTSQLPVNSWHESIGDPTLADAILDRIVHNAYQITLSGESMRKLKSEIKKEDNKST